MAEIVTAVSVKTISPPEVSVLRNDNFFKIEVQNKELILTYEEADRLNMCLSKVLELGK